MKIHRAVKEKFIIDYLREHKFADIMNVDFVDKYTKAFNPKVVIQPFGANGCPELGRLLSSMYKGQILTRCSIGMSGLEVCFPKWVYVYELNE